MTCRRCEETDARVLWMLRVLGDEFGPLGVARLADHLANHSIGKAMDTTIGDAVNDLPVPVLDLTADDMVAEGLRYANAVEEWHNRRQGIVDTVTEQVAGPWDPPPDPPEDVVPVHEAHLRGYRLCERCDVCGKEPGHPGPGDPVPTTDLGPLVIVVDPHTAYTIGSIIPQTVAEYARAGYVPADGRALSQSDYPDLYAVIGDNYRRPDDTPDTFAPGLFRVPDLRSRS